MAGKTCCASKVKELGIRNIENCNIALPSKWGVEVPTGQNALWHKVIEPFMALIRTGGTLGFRSEVLITDLGNQFLPFVMRFV